MNTLELKEELKKVNEGLQSLSKVVEYLSTKVESTTITKTNIPIKGKVLQPDGDYKLYPKDTVLMSDLLRVVTNEKSKNFLLNVLNNDYSTITQGQKDIIDQIVEQNSFMEV